MGIASCALLLLTAPPAHAACRILVTIPQRWDGARVAAVSLAFNHAAIFVLHAPPGWRFDVDNDASWRTRLKGRAAVGAAFIPPSAVAALVQLAPEPGHACSGRGSIQFVHATLTFYRDDRLHSVTLPGPALAITD